MLLRLDKTKIPCQNLISFEILDNKRNLSQISAIIITSIKLFWRHDEQAIFSKK